MVQWWLEKDQENQHPLLSLTWTMKRGSCRVCYHLISRCPTHCHHTCYCPTYQCQCGWWQRVQWQPMTATYVWQRLPLYMLLSYTVTSYTEAVWMMTVCLMAAFVIAIGCRRLLHFVCSPVEHDLNTDSISTMIAGVPSNFCLNGNSWSV